MKTCTECKEEKRLEEFPKRKSAPDGRQYYCRPCTREKRRLNYLKDPTQKTRYGIQTSERKDEYKRRVYAYLLEHPCLDCAETDPVVLDFDHVRGIKKANVAQMVAQGYSWQDIVNEIAKCDIRCANCHRRKTAKEKNYYQWLK